MVSENEIKRSLKGSINKDGEGRRIAGKNYFEETNERILEFREEETVKKLSELFGKLNKLPSGLPEKFDIFRSYFRGIQDGFFITLHSLDIEPTERQRSITELRIDIIMNSFETGKNDIRTTWEELDRELPLSRIYS